MSYWYLATPYSKYRDGIDEAWKLACREAALLIRAGVPVYSPIAHTHPVAIHGGIDPYDHGIWLPADEPMMRAARGLIVLRAAGWTHSFGITFEMRAFEAADKPVLFMDPGVFPVGLVSHA